MECEICFQRPATGLTCLDPEPENSIEWLATCSRCAQPYLEKT